MGATHQGGAGARPACGADTSAQQGRGDPGTPLYDVSHTGVFSRLPGGYFTTPGGISMAQKRNRPDHDGTHRLAFERNKKRIYATQTVCGICGKPVDFSLKYPHPMSPCIDHIIPIAKGGHPSDIDNLQLAHWCCNRKKSDKIKKSKAEPGILDTISNRILPQSCDWAAYRSK